MRIRAVVAVAALALAAMAAAACGSGRGLFRQYEYEEEIYLSLDGTATMYVNSSIAALNALRGTSFDASPIARIDRQRVREYFSSPNTHVTGFSTSRRSNRQFVHVRMDVDDVRRLPETMPFSWSRYEFKRDGNLFIYRQTIGAAAAGKRDAGPAGWNGRETVAFRLHLPSKVAYHNTGRGVGRGNILVWEQPLTDRLRGVPLTLDARMETQSILFRTLYLFGLTFVAVAFTFALVIWWVLRKGAKTAEG
ncbi:MAG TPA: hypothetical protein VKI43_17955 [Vicinamibacterales bacterium]|jgi:hypothetical protein|nr:hypothetical protein [Vicinamibacterales bacterium]